MFRGIAAYRLWWSGVRLRFRKKARLAEELRAIWRGTGEVHRDFALRNLVLVTTHDVELQELLADCSRMFHFSEVVEGTRYFFDYRLRPGPCGAGNAVKLIELRGFPNEVVETAKSQVKDRQQVSRSTESQKL